MRSKKLISKLKNLFSVYSLNNNILLLIVFFVLMIHLVVFLFYARNHRQAVVKVNHEIVSQQVIQLIQTIKLAKPAERPAIVKAIAIPNIKVTLEEAPQFDVKLKSHSLWRVLTALHKQEKEMKVSLELATGNWLSIAATVVPVTWPYQVLLLSLELIIAVVVIFFFWMVNRFAAPLIEFTRAAERLGQDINSPPIHLTAGPAVVRDTADAMNKMQQKIKDLIRDRTQMLAAMSHDLRTPITRLKLRAQFLEEGEQQAKILSDLDEMEQMISSILGFARDDQREEQKVTLDLNSLLLSICDDYKDMGAAVDFVGVDKRLLFVGRTLALKRALNNIIGNAIKYANTAQVTLTLNDNEIAIVVKDDGPGLPEEELQKVLAPFYRAEKSRSRDTGGTGLGLAIAHDIVRDHQGTLTLANHPDGGLQVAVVLHI